MKEREKWKKTSHHRPQCAKWFSRYSISKSGIWARWTSPFSRFSASQALHGLAPKCKLINMHELINKSTNDYVTLLHCKNDANVNNKG